MRQPSATRPGEPEPGREIRFCATPSGVRIGYATVGGGPPLVVPAAWIGHLGLSWQDPATRAFYAPIAAARTVIHYDKPGCGLSDPWPGRQTVDTDLEVLLTVVDHLGLARFDLLGVSMGAPVSVAFSARHPERVASLVLYGGFADGGEIGTPPVRAAMVDMVRAHWGLGSDVLADVFLPDGSAEDRARFAALQRGSATAALAADLLVQCYETAVAWYLCAMGDGYARVVAEQGYADEVRAVVAANPRPSPRHGTVPDEAEALMEQFTAAGTPGDVRDRLKSWDEEVDVTMLGLPPGMPWATIEATLRAAAA